ncbi:hypothetical protein [Rubinisphaera italica]|uniref:Uncharacterized protein n=1 Tax=Rubinisphaera italica TaxID=2527969 RepID=A0A5C5XHV1_9PLAN|nr:hypothetical protein [Rubinisphaera italica]TWT62384.1 hypothetical protein Pan54_31260 [Rubinisphaera italica]
MCYWDEEIEEGFLKSSMKLEEMNQKYLQQLHLLLKEYETKLSNPEFQSHAQILTHVSHLMSGRIHKEYLWQWVLRMADQFSEDDKISSALIISILEPAVEPPVFPEDRMQVMKLLANHQTALLLFSAFDCEEFPGEFPEYFRQEYSIYEACSRALQETPVVLNETSLQQYVQNYRR